MMKRSAPDHVPAECVVDIDMYAIAGGEDDFYAAWQKLQRPDGPAFLWTPHNGGHWIALRGRDISEICGDPTRFSSAGALIPKVEADPYKLCPLELDPPEHTPYRNAVNKGVASQLARMQAHAVRLTNGILDGMIARGHCEFISEIAEILPISLFLAFADLPPQDVQILLPLSAKISAHSAENSSDHLMQLADGYLRPIVEERLRAPGEDALSRMFAEPINGKNMTMDSAMSIARDVLFASLDTVSSNLGFLLWHLATHPGLRRELTGKSAHIPAAVDDIVRRYGTIHGGREVVKDLEMSGTQLKKGDIICLPFTLYNLDQTLFECPMQVKLDRRSGSHKAFGGGPHRCPGASMARLELSAFAGEWLRRIPDFEIDPAHPVQMKAGAVVAALKDLHLRWPAG